MRAIVHNRVALPGAQVVLILSPLCMGMEAGDRGPQWEPADPAEEFM